MGGTVRVVVSSPEVVVLALSGQDARRVLPVLARFTRLVGAGTRRPTPGLHSGAWRDALSPRECEVMDLVAEGLDNNEIAARLDVSVKTVKNHITSIFAKLGVRTRAQAVVRWLTPKAA